MRSRRILWLLLLACASPASAQYQTALPGYHYTFPRDHFNHEEYQTEWWYYTGNVTSQDGHRFGFELTFFRHGVSRNANQNATWDIRDVYLAHLALSDLDGQEFFHAERTNRAGPGIAGIDETRQRIWNGNWQVTWTGSAQELRAFDERFVISLTLQPEKPPVLHGEDGVSQKATGPGRASHYISLTRIKTTGTIQLFGKTFPVSGLSWMDHEFFTHQLGPDQVGWDWFSLQLSDNTELMLFRIRRKDGTIDPFSAGTYVDELGHSAHLRAEEFTLKPMGDTWKSSRTSASYPIAWRIYVQKLGIELTARTPLNSQELPGNTEFAPSYWEGAIRLTGQRDKAPLTGSGYLEMTGYDRPVEFGPQTKLSSQ